MQVVVLAETIRSLHAAVFSKSDVVVKNSCFVLGLSEFKDIINKPHSSAVRELFSSLRLRIDCRIRISLITAGCIWRVLLS